MTIEKWMDAHTDDFIIVDSDGDKLYDTRTTTHEPRYYIMESLITDEYTWHDIIVLTI